jgi:hypothetical protein
LFHVRDALIPFHQIVYGFPYLLIFADKREYVYTFIGKYIGGAMEKHWLAVRNNISGGAKKYV